ncbi:MAG: 16S rRNA (guanine(966)-N(2))-methyltransferase RsmD [Candidatus Omnitrophota bacterium]
MRIIGGEGRGRQIKMPKGAEVRPTQDRVREAIFNVIREKIPGSDVLDLFAGSGAFGIEALSRAAHSVIFVDNNINCIRAIKANLTVLGEDREIPQVLKTDAVRAISRFQKKGRKFDIIFLDPPYYKGLAKNSLIKINACDILSQHGFVVVEHFKKDALPEKAGDIFLFKEKRYGDTAVSFYRRK